MIEPYKGRVYDPCCGSSGMFVQSEEFILKHGGRLGKMGRLVDRTHRELTDEEIKKISATYHAWRGEKNAGKHKDVPGFCKSAKIEEVTSHGYVLTPGRYVGAEAQEDDGEPFEEKMKRLVAELISHFKEGKDLEGKISNNMKSLGFV